MAYLSPDVAQRARAAATALQSFGAVRAVYVFGSQVTGNAGPWSDIDLAVFMDGLRSWEIVRAVMHVQDHLGYDVETHLFPSDELSNPTPCGFADYVMRHGTFIMDETVHS